jgi:hypothetical protein
MAFESPQVTAACVEATEFMDLSRKYRVTGVPKTIINGTVEIVDAVVGGERRTYNEERRT